MGHPHLHANRKKLMGRGLLEVVRINVSNIRPCNRQCTHRLIPCIEISFVGQAQGGLNALQLVASPWRGCFGLKDPLINPCRSCGIRSKNFFIGRDRYWRFWKCRVRLSRASWYCFLFFCWRLLGLIPGGAPFSQLSSGVKDAKVVSTEVKCHL